jgi:hypothetical protein
MAIVVSAVAVRVGGCIGDGSPLLIDLVSAVGRHEAPERRADR